jgi:dihydroxyacid dehydratase/phosphogluconate dehydratase
MKNRLTWRTERDTRGCAARNTLVKLTGHGEGDQIVFDLATKSLRVELSHAEIKARFAKWEASAIRNKTGVFVKYAVLVSSASLGAITTANV